MGLGCQGIVHPSGGTDDAVAGYIQRVGRADGAVHHTYTRRIGSLVTSHLQRSEGVW